MNEERLDELLWERIDQVIRPEDAAELREHLEGSPEARAHERRLDEFVATLATVHEVEPPPALRRRIDAALAAKRLSSPPRWGAASWAEALRELWSPKPLLRYALLAGAFLIGAISYHLVAGGDGSSRLDPAKLYGSTGIARQESPAGAWTLELPEERGWVALHRRGSLLVLDMALAVEGHGEVKLHFPEAGFHLETLEHFGAPPSRLQATADAVDLQLMGPSRCTLVTEVGDPAQQVEIRISAGDEQPLQSKLRLDDLPELAGRRPTS